jgi:hypothetical protein
LEEFNYEADDSQQGAKANASHSAPEKKDKGGRTKSDTKLEKSPEH